MRFAPKEGPLTQPTEGMPCTIGIGSDRYAAEVVKVLSPKRILIGRGGGKTEEWSLRKDNRWRPKGCDERSGYSLALGHAEDYRDPSF